MMSRSAESVVVSSRVIPSSGLLSRTAVIVRPRNVVILPRWMPVMWAAICAPKEARPGMRERLMRAT